MVQIIQGKNNSIGSRLSRAVGAGLEEGQNLYNQYQQQQQASQRNSAVKEFSEKLGLGDISAFPEEIQKSLLTEGLKQKGSLNKQSQSQEFLSQLLDTGNQQQESNFQQTDPSQQESSTQGFDVSKLTDSQIAKATALDPNLGKVLQSQRDAAERRESSKRKEKLTEFQADRDYHSKVSQPIIDAAQGSIKEAPIKKGLIAQQRRDISSGNTEGIIPYLVDELGLEFARTPEASRFKSASKNRFIENLESLGGAGARPNQFIEQQLVAAQPTIGRNAESNNTVLDMEEFIEDMKLQRAKLELQLAEEDREKYGFAKNDIAQRAEKQMKDYTEKRQDEMAYSIRNRHEERLSDSDLLKEMVMENISPDTPLTLRMARLLMIKNHDDERKAQAEAKRLGFKIPKE